SSPAIGSSTSVFFVRRPLGDVAVPVVKPAVAPFADVVCSSSSSSSSPIPHSASSPSRVFLRPSSAISLHNRTDISPPRRVDPHLSTPSAASGCVGELTDSRMSHNGVAQRNAVAQRFASTSDARTESLAAEALYLAQTAALVAKEAAQLATIERAMLRQVTTSKDSSKTTVESSWRDCIEVGEELGQEELRSVWMAAGAPVPLLNPLETSRNTQLDSATRSFLPARSALIGDLTSVDLLQQARGFWWDEEVGEASPRGSTRLARSASVAPERTSNAMLTDDWSLASPETSPRQGGDSTLSALSEGDLSDREASGDSGDGDSTEATGQSKPRSVRTLIKSRRKGMRMEQREKARLKRYANRSSSPNSSLDSLLLLTPSRTSAKPAKRSAKAPTKELPEASEEKELTFEEFRRVSNDPIFAMFESAGGNSRLLTAAEEIEYSKGVQELLRLERARDAAEKALGRAPTMAEWAEAAGVSVAEVRRREARGRECKKAMMASNMRLVISVAKKYCRGGVGLQELITEGCMGLMKGIERFDHKRGFKFSTYAHWWIRQAITRSVAEQTRTVRLPAHILELLSRIAKARDLLWEQLGRVPSDSELASLVGLTPSKLRAAVRNVRAPCSMDRPISSDGEETLGAFVEDSTLECPEERMMQQLLKRDLQQVLGTLTPREREVMWHRYGLDDGRAKTLEELGVMFRVTRERIRQIESKALLKLRQPERGGGLKGYVDGLAVVEASTMHSGNSPLMSSPPCDTGLKGKEDSSPWLPDDIDIDAIMSYDDTDDACDPKPSPGSNDVRASCLSSGRCDQIPAKAADSTAKDEIANRRTGEKIAPSVKTILPVPCDTATIMRSCDANSHESKRQLVAMPTVLAAGQSQKSVMFWASAALATVAGEKNRPGVAQGSIFRQCQNP
ncbi:unnamed protein product, partial [Closterium sp. Yama58-4]